MCVCVRERASVPSYTPVHVSPHSAGPAISMNFSTAATTPHWGGEGRGGEGRGGEGG